jgi:PAS domain-containing protein
MRSYRSFLGKYHPSDYDVQAVCSTHDVFSCAESQLAWETIVGNAPKRPASHALKRPSGELVDRLFDLSLDMLGAASFDGWSLTDLMAEPYVSFLHPDDVEAAKARMVLLKGSDVQVLGYKSRFRKSDGQYLTLQWNAIVEDNAVFFVGHDITASSAIEVERDQTARVMEAVIENVDDGIYVADATGHMTLINPAAVELLGYASADEQPDSPSHLSLQPPRWCRLPH